MIIMIYVDRLQRTRRPPKQAWSYYNFCHLTADTKEELISFAEQLGLREEYIQVSRNGTLHFDLTKNKRFLAIKFGAKIKDYNTSKTA
jgi:hypothetical protein